MSSQGVRSQESGVRMKEEGRRNEERNKERRNYLIAGKERFGIRSII